MQSLQEDTCAICLSDLSLDKNGPLEQKPIAVQPCGHLYHLDCIAKWLGRSNNCPICRAIMMAGTTHKRRRERVLGCLTLGRVKTFLYAGMAIGACASLASIFAFGVPPLLAGLMLGLLVCGISAVVHQIDDL